MRDEVHNLVYPFIRLGLDVKDQLDAGERLDMQETRLKFMRLLADKKWDRLEGDSSAGNAVGEFTLSRSLGGAMGGKGSSSFMGIRYALVCWLDELYILHSPWALEWRDNALELARYNSAEAAWKFWEEARKAEGHGGDALEVFYLCVMLGFRGDWRDLPQDLDAWVERVRPQIIREMGEEPAQTDKSEPVNYVPLLTGRDRFSGMFRWWGAFVFTLLFVLVVLIVLKLQP